MRYDSKNPHLYSCPIQIQDTEEHAHRAVNFVKINIDGKFLDGLTDLEDCCFVGYGAGFSTSKIPWSRVWWDSAIGSHFFKCATDQFEFEIMPKHRPIIKEFYCRLQNFISERRIIKEEEDEIKRLISEIDGWGLGEK